MILILVLAGFVVGATAAIVALGGGASLIAALAAYALFGLGAVVLTAILVALGPAWTARRRPPPPVGLRLP